MHWQDCMMSDDAELTGRQRFVEAGKATRFQAGNAGRPKGARNKLGEEFLEALHEDFKEHGVSAVREVRETKPDQYLKVIASLLPKDVNLNVSDYGEMTDDELIDRIRELDAAISPFLASREDGVGEASSGKGRKGNATRVH